MLNTTVETLLVINVPKDPDNGRLKNVVFGMLYFEFRRLHVITYEFTGEIIGVVVDKKLCVLFCVVTGYIPKFNPIKLPNV